MTERIEVWCAGCQNDVLSWGIEDWRACPRCHRRGTLRAVMPLEPQLTEESDIISEAPWAPQDDPRWTH